MDNYRRLHSVIGTLLDQKKYSEAFGILEKEVASFNENNSDDWLWLCAIAGSYISLGGEWLNTVAVNKGLRLVKECRDKMALVITEASINYYEGNAYSALCSIELNSKPYALPKPKDTDIYFKAKNSYLKSLKEIDLNKLDKFSKGVLTNIANSLNLTGRVVEALQYYDMVLKTDSKFVNALHGKAECLVFLVRYTKFSKTQNLFATIYSLYSFSQKSGPAPEHIEKSTQMGIDMAKKTLIDLNFDMSKIDEEFFISKQEYIQHDKKTKFFIDNFFGLSEHGIYCNCSQAANEELILAFDNYITKDKKLLQLEMCLSRIKSEFDMARELFYEYSIGKDEHDNLQYPDFKNSIVNGKLTERLRTSYRLCFGIFDKIAGAICLLLEIPNLNENELIYFNSFWFKDNKTRQEIINSRNNVHLTALYCIASDLNKKHGEMSFYKEWRNELEHGSLLLRNNLSSDPYQLIDSKLFPINQSIINFEMKTKQVLQLTRSAIFSFVYCVREELIPKSNS